MFTFPDQPQKLHTFSLARAADPAVREYAGKIPSRVLLDGGRVVADLRFVGLALILAAGADAAVGCDAFASGVLLLSSIKLLTMVLLSFR